MKKLLFLTIFAILLFGIWQTCFAVDLLLDYPDVPGAQKLSEASDLPNIINYIYKFALLACGITAFISILFGAIQYVTSAGDSSKAGDAKKRITDALWGILILLSAVLILRTINPDLVSLKFTLPEAQNSNEIIGNYPYTQCVISKEANCDSTTTDQIIIRSCTQSEETTISDARLTCERKCIELVANDPNLNGLVRCEVYLTKDKCQAVKDCRKK